MEVSYTILKGEQCMYSCKLFYDKSHISKRVKEVVFLLHFTVFQTSKLISN